LQHWAKEQHRHGQCQIDPEALSKHLLVAGVVHVCAVPTLLVARMTIVHRTVFRVCAVSGQMSRVAPVRDLPAMCRGMTLVPAIVLLMVLCV